MKLTCLQDLLLVCKSQLHVQAFRSSWDRTVASQKGNSHLPKKGWVCFIPGGLSVGSTFLLICHRPLANCLKHWTVELNWDLFLLCSLEQVFLARLWVTQWIGWSSNPKCWYVFPLKYKESQKAMCLFLSFQEWMITAVWLSCWKNIQKFTKPADPQKSYWGGRSLNFHTLAHLCFTKESRTLCTPCFPGPISMISFYRQSDILWDCAGVKVPADYSITERIDAISKKTVKFAPFLLGESKLPLVLSVHKDGENSICQINSHRIIPHVVYLLQ